MCKEKNIDGECTLTYNEVTLIGAHEKETNQNLTIIKKGSVGNVSGVPIRHCKSA